MSDIIDIISSAKNVLSLKGANIQEVKKAQEKLDLVFSIEYAKYTMQYGAVCINNREYTGVVENPDLSVVYNTYSARTITPQAHDDWYVISDLHIDGIIIWQDIDGLIYQTQPGCKPVLICKSMAEYINSQ